MVDEPERRLLAEIGELADRIRSIRRTRAREDSAKIASLSEDLRGKWERLRRLRAPAAPALPENRSHYR
jgi:hypothetical protein